jgi:hypothetical protein
MINDDRVVRFGELASRAGAKRRQYEALRGYFVEGRPSHEVARAFGYTPASFRVLCHQFRRDPQPAFFATLPRGPQSQPKKSAARELIVALRKRNHSVYEISEALRQHKHVLRPIAVRETAPRRRNPQGCIDGRRPRKRRTATRARVRASRRMLDRGRGSHPTSRGPRMCGIFGIVAQDDRPLGELMCGAARRLAYRGYDSVGMVTLDGAGSIDLRKDVGKVGDVAERLRFSEMHGRRGIVQLRWATFGAPSTVNAQPHLDSDGDLVGAHNGNVVNNVELREAFLAEGMTVRSTNDGESCVHAVERYVDRGESLIDAIRHAYDVLEGDYAFVIASVHDDRLYAFKKGSGLVVGVGDDFACCSSDLPSILPLTSRIVRVRDGEIVCLAADGVELRRV